jgi:hypothetical protein
LGAKTPRFRWSESPSAGKVQELGK